MFGPRMLQYSSDGPKLHLDRFASVRADRATICVELLTSLAAAQGVGLRDSRRPRRGARYLPTRMVCDFPVLTKIVVVPGAWEWAKECEVLQFRVGRYPAKLVLRGVQYSYTGPHHQGWEVQAAISDRRRLHHGRLPASSGAYAVQPPMLTLMMLLQGRDCGRDPRHRCALAR
eukprot:3210892-Rhodomonas_salina.1